MSPASVSFRALGTTALLWVTQAEALPAAHAALERELDEIDVACSRFRADSDLSRVNAAGGAVTAVGERLVEALAVALRAAAATDGLVTPTVGRALRLLGYDRSFELVGGRRVVVASAPPAPPWAEIEIDETAGTVRLPAGCELDLGATAKALAADRAATAAAAETGAGVLVGLGGDIALAGRAPDAGWPVRIADDHAAAIDSPGPVVSLASGGLASSSTDVRRWRSESLELHHIVDPRTGRPAAAPWRTVSVAASSCVDANVASTAAVVLGADAPGWLAARGLPARLVAASGEVLRLAGWPGDTP